MYKVSILVPVFGVERYIEQCARSLFGQTYTNLEFVFVDDGSPDRSMEILKSVIKDFPQREDSIRIVAHEKNKGLAVARNSALENSRGQFICCVDSDDWLEQDAIEQLVSKQMDGNNDIVTGNYLVHSEDEDRLIRAQDYLNKKQMVLAMMQRTWDHFVTGRLLRRSLFIDNGLRWNDGLDVAEDRYMMTMLAYHAASFANTDCEVYHYNRQNASALTSEKSGRKVVRNNRQELENVLLLERFFKDKDPIYQKECSRCIIEQLHLNLWAALDFWDRKEYYHALRILRSRHGGDNKKGLSGWIRSRYGWKVLSRIKNNVKHFISK